MSNRPLPARREIFVLTPEERKTICFVIAALILGLSAKQYRALRPPPAIASLKSSQAVPRRSPAKAKVKKLRQLRRESDAPEFAAPSDDR